MNYTLQEIATICGGELHGPDQPVHSVIFDSRSTNQTNAPLFVAIRGANHDGHDHIGELYARGVRSFLIQEELPYERYPLAGFVHARNAVQALQALAADYRNRFTGTVVAVTGSNGKTVVKEWIAQLAPKGVRIFRSPKSYNSQIGVPLSLLMMEGNEQIAIIEAGISRPREMEPLAEIIRPDIGIFTTVGDAHQENFINTQEKLDEKIKLFARCDTIIYNGTYPMVAETLRHAYPRTRLVDSSKTQLNDTRFPDQASRENAASAVTLYDVLGYDHLDTLAGLTRLQPVAMRLELKEGLGGSIIVNDSYNSDINSLGIALDYQRSVAAGRKRTLILSDILQSGLTDNELYGRVAKMVNLAGIDTFIGVGENIRRYAPYFHCEKEFYATTNAFLRAVNQERVAGRAILVKGNRSAQFERLVHTLERKSHTTVLEVDLDAMIHNLAWYRSRLTPQTRLMAMVKASGYGNGNYEIANMLQRQGVDFLAVAFADEGVLLRERGISMPIVVLNADSDSFDLMIANRLEPEIYNFRSLETFVGAVRRHGERDYPIHIKIDSGMHRLGFERKDIDVLNAMLIDQEPLVYVRSIFSHLAAADAPTEDEFTRGQIRLFDELSRAVCDALPYEPLRHVANSAAIERFPEARFDMCRLGIGLYGIGSGAGALQPVSRLTTRIVQIKELDPSQTVGYGRKGTLTQPSRIATVPIGYADGLDRHLSCGRWSMLIHGKQAPVVGRICMDSCMIDVTGIDAAEGDTVVIFSGEPGNTVEDMARVLDKIPYEVMTGISTRVKRIFIKE